MLLVVLGRELGRDLHQLHAGDLEALLLEAAEDVADEAALDGVGLEQDQSAIHGQWVRIRADGLCLNEGEDDSEPRPATTTSFEAEGLGDRGARLLGAAGLFGRA